MRTLARSITLFLGLAFGLHLPLWADCGATTFTPVAPYVPPPQTHNAYFLTDPAGEQRAVFDLHWGGALASLQYQGAEYAWGGATGGMVQPAMHHGIGSQDYNPTVAGDQHNLGSITSGVRCLGSNILYLMSGAILDYSYGLSGHIVANAVRAGSVVANSYATPYYVVTIASFVKNPAGTPAYYLRIQQTVTNVDPAELIFWSFEIAGYVPGNLLTWVQYPTNCTDSAPCASPSTPALLGGLYPSGSLQGGTAFYISPKAYWRSGSALVTFGADTQTYHNAATHLFSGQWGLAPGHSRTFVFFVLVGNWSNALAFGTSPNPPLSFFTVTPCRVVDTRLTGQTIASNSPVVFQIGSACGIPANAVSVAFNVTAVGATADVSLTVYPGDLASPPTTNVVSASASHQTIASNAVIPLATNGNGTVAVAASFSSSGAVDVVLDLTGYFLP